MRRIVEVCVLLALALVGMSSNAMPLGARTLLHGHAVARQLAEAEPTPQIWTVTFDANGGVVIGEDESGGLGTSRPTSVTNGCVIGELPVAMRTDYMFEGWFMAADGGEQVTAETVINSDMTLYAHWQCRFAFGDGDDWTQLPDGSWKSGATADGATNSLSMTVNGAGIVSFRWKTSCEDYFNFKGMLLRQDSLSFCVDREERGFANGIMSGWAECSFVVDGTGRHVITWAYIKDVSGVEGDDCAWLCNVVWTPVVPSVPGDPDAVVSGDAVSGFTVKPSATSGAVEVTIPSGVDAAKVTVEVPPTVESVTPHGATIKIVKGGHDITQFLDIPAADGGGAVATHLATVKEAIVKEAIDTSKGAEVDLKPSAPSITTAPTRPGLTYTFSEGTTLDGMTQRAEKQGDGEPWTPPVTVKGGTSGFYSIGVGK